MIINFRQIDSHAVLEKIYKYFDIVEMHDLRKNLNDRYYQNMKY
jgi:hypothetical protein